MNQADIRLFSTDLDGTLIGNAEAAARFTRTWETLPAARRPLLVYNTGRSVADTRAIAVARRLPEPDFIIGSIGTELHDSLYNQAGEFQRQFGAAWNLQRVNEIVSGIPGVKPQPAEFTQAFKSSWYWVRARREDLEGLRRRLRDEGIDAHLDYSCRYFLDVVPACAGKGRALAWLCARLHVALDHVLVAGDTGNDIEMFRLAGVHGIVVENALPELLAAVLRPGVYVARNAMADGVLEGLAHFGIVEPAGGEGVATRTLARSS